MNQSSLHSHGRLGPRAHLLVLSAYILFTLLLTWPLAQYFFTTLPAVSDPLKHTWRIAWVSNQLITNPLELYNANSFYAYPNSFAFDDLMLTQGLLAIPVVLATGNPVAGHNFIILSSFAFCAYTMFLLAYHFTRNVYASFLAGLIFAFSTRTRNPLLSPF